MELLNIIGFIGILLLVYVWGYWMGYLDRKRNNKMRGWHNYGTR